MIYIKMENKNSKLIQNNNYITSSEFINFKRKLMVKLIILKKKQIIQIINWIESQMIYQIFKQK